MRYISELIRQVRNDSSFKLFTSGTGIQDIEIVDLLNHGQTIAVSKITQASGAQAPFQKEVIISVSGGVSNYFTKGLLLHNLKVIDVQFKAESSQKFLDLEKSTIREIGKAGAPKYQWALQNGDIVVEVPESVVISELKIIYENKPLALAQRAGIIISGSGKDGQLLAMNINYMTNFSDANFNADIDRYVCVVDKDGKLLMRNIPYKNISSGVFALDAFAYETGETADIGDYVVIGKDSSTHTSLGSEFEVYLVYFVVEQLSITKGVGEEKRKALTNRALSALETVVSSYSDGDKDYTNPTITEETIELFSGLIC